MIPASQAGHQVAPRTWAHRDGEAGDDLDAPDGTQRLLGIAGDEIVDLGGQEDAPVDEPVEELVDPDQDRGGGEADPKQGQGLVGGFVEPAPGGLDGHCSVGGWTSNLP